MRKGQLEVLFAIGFFFVFIAVAVVWSYGLPSNKALSRQVEDIKPYRRSMYLTQNLEPLYVEPAFKYSLQHASYQVASSESLSVWTPDAVDSTTPTLEERIRQQLEAEAFRTFRSKMQSLTFRGNCTLVNFDRDAASFYQITDRRTIKKGKRGIAFSPTESSPVGVRCGVPYAKYTSYFSLGNEWFAAGNRYFALSDIARHIAAYPQLNCDLVDLPNHGNTPSEMEDWLSNQVDQYQNHFQNNYKSGDPFYDGIDVQIVVRNVTKDDATGDVQAAIDITVVDTTNSIPTTEGSRQLRFNALYRYREGEHKTEAENIGGC